MLLLPMAIRWAKTHWPRLLQNHPGVALTGARAGAHACAGAEAGQNLQISRLRKIHSARIHVPGIARQLNGLKRIDHVEPDFDGAQQQRHHDQHDE
jgi:hypothetical protein